MFYDIKWISSGAFEFETKNNKQSLKIDPGTQKKLGIIKQLQHFILCNMMCYGPLKSNIDQGRSTIIV